MPAIFIMAIVGYFLYQCALKKEEWVAFVYPDKNNLTIDVEVGTFSDFNLCQSAALSYIIEHKNGHDQDFECALNCDRSKGKPYICEKTSR